MTPMSLLPALALVLALPLAGVSELAAPPGLPALTAPPGPPALTASPGLPATGAEGGQSAEARTTVRADGPRTLDVADPPPTARAPDPQTTLEAAAERFARLWAAGESAALADFVAAAGVRLQLERANRSPLPARQAAAALRDYFAGHRAGNARLGRVSEVGGMPERGFAEVIWQAAAAGTTETTTVTVYVGFVRESEGEDHGSWKVDEIRVLPGGG